MSKALGDIEYAVLDMLMRARHKGVHKLNRQELLASEAIPTGLRMKLVWAALTMPDVVEWIAQDDFAITENGIHAYNLRFGRDGNQQPPTPSNMADAIIYLPDNSHPVN